MCCGPAIFTLGFTSTRSMLSRFRTSHTGNVVPVLVACAVSCACTVATPDSPAVDELQLAGATVSVPRVVCPQSHEGRASSQPKNTARRKVHSAGFVFYLPSLERCDGPLSAEEFHEDRVLFTVEASVPGQDGRHPHADIEGELERLAGVSYTPGQTTELEGLTCFPLPPNRRVQECMGTRENGERFLISVPRPPHEDWMRFPIAQTTYFSRELGGVQVLWRVHVKHIGEWRQIDAHAWQMLRSWATAHGQQAAGSNAR